MPTATLKTYSSNVTSIVSEYNGVVPNVSKEVSFLNKVSCKHSLNARNCFKGNLGLDLGRE